MKKKYQNSQRAMISHSFLLGPNSWKYSKCVSHFDLIRVQWRSSKNQGVCERLISQQHPPRRLSLYCLYSSSREKAVGPGEPWLLPFGGSVNNSHTLLTAESWTSAALGLYCQVLVRRHRQPNKATNALLSVQMSLSPLPFVFPYSRGRKKWSKNLGIWISGIPFVWWSK